MWSLFSHSGLYTLYYANLKNCKTEYGIIDCCAVFCSNSSMLSSVLYCLIKHAKLHKDSFLRIWFYFSDVKYFPSDVPATPLECISMYSAVPNGSHDMFYSLVPWLALCNGQLSLQAPGPNWTSPVKTFVAAAHLHGPASTNCHWGLPNTV